MCTDQIQGFHWVDNLIIWFMYLRLIWMNKKFFIYPW